MAHHAPAYRTLRRLGVSLERMKSDIKDFEPAGVACLGSGQPWVGMGQAPLRCRNRLCPAVYGAQRCAPLRKAFEWR